MRKLTLITALLLTFCTAMAQQPKLAINIIVGGMKATDLTRYSDNFTAGGFSRLISEGTTFTECYLDFIPTLDQTALSTIATGTLPSTHGISSHLWFDRTSNNKQISLYKDANDKLTADHFIAQTLAEAVIESAEGAMAVTLAHNFASAMSLAGRSSECYWLDNTGNWTTAEPYQMLPKWVSIHNEVGFNSIFVSDRWHGKFAKNKYHNKTATDIAVYDIYSKPKNNNKKLSTTLAEALATTPAGNGAIFELAKKCIEQMFENKENNECKLLNICLDTPRDIAAKYGPNSIEYEDMLYCLDATIAEFLAFVDKQVSDKNYIVTLTSDHGMGKSVSENQEYFNPEQSEVILNAFLSAKYGQGSWVLDCSRGNIYLNRDLIYAHKLSLEQVQNEAATFALQFRGVANAVTATALQGGQMPEGAPKLMQNSFYPRRSGDIVYSLQPNYYEQDSGKKAYSGSPFGYDRHIPLIIRGGGFLAGRISEQRVSSTAIAATIASALGLEDPYCADGVRLKQ